MKKILIIDDDDDIRQLLRHLLEEAGYHVLEAANGAMGVQLAEEEHPQLLIVDMLMPEKEGLETIAEIRSRLENVKIIAISGGGRAGNMSSLEMAKKIGANKTLSKPFRAAELWKAVNSLLDS